MVRYSIAMVWDPYGRIEPPFKRKALKPPGRVFITIYLCFDSIAMVYGSLSYCYGVWVDSFAMMILLLWCMGYGVWFDSIAMVYGLTPLIWCMVRLCDGVWFDSIARQSYIVMGFYVCGIKFHYYGVWFAIILVWDPYGGIEPPFKRKALKPPGRVFITLFTNLLY